MYREIIIFYNIHRGPAKKSHGRWRRRRWRLLAVFLLLHISPAASALCQSAQTLAATEDYYVIITSNYM
jgi:type II secretory pathway component PulL